MFHVKQSDEYMRFVEYITTVTSEGQQKKLVQYFDMLIQYNKTINLFSRKNEGLIIKHFIDAVSGATALDFTNKIIDIGSGNGLPGIVIGIIFPETQIKIYERKERKSVFLNLVKNRLQIDNITIYNSSFDNEVFDGFDIIMKGVNPYDIKPFIQTYIEEGRVYYFSSGSMISDFKKEYYIPIFDEKHAIIRVDNQMLKDGEKWERS